jgi:uncharacterized protein YjiS (DUF1127 family)
MEVTMLKQLRAAVRRANEQARHRREYATLLELDDYMLRDIGLDRSDVHARLAGRHLG